MRLSVLVLDLTIGQPLALVFHSPFYELCFCPISSYGLVDFLDSDVGAFCLLSFFTSPPTLHLLAALGFFSRRAHNMAGAVQSQISCFSIKNLFCPTFAPLNIAVKSTKVPSKLFKRIQSVPEDTQTY